MNKSTNIYSLKCKHCNNPFKGSSSTSKCCSDKCYKEYYSKLYNKSIKCQNPNCNNELSINQIKNPKIKFCSYECCKKHRIYPTFTSEQKISMNQKQPVFSRASKRLLEKLGEEKFKEFNDRDFIIRNFIKDNIFLRDKCSDYFGVSTGLINARKATVWEIKVKNKTKLTNFSSKEKEVYLFLKKEFPSFDFKWREFLNKEIFIHPKNKSISLECDILVFKENSMIAEIEYNGSYWHSDKFPETIKRDREKEKQAKYIPGFKLFQVKEGEEKLFYESFKSYSVAFAKN